MGGFKGNDIAILGMVGGVIGLLMGLVALVAGGIGSLLHIYGAFSFFQSSWIAIFLSLVGLAGAFITRIESLVGGVPMAVSGALGVYLVGGFFLIPSAFLIVAGIIAVVDSFRRWDTKTF
ncbi:hypothetical protein IX51_10415 [uncultured archaeon]|nr:hypothetical protein IX51_10415 [uncultured archaeon]